MWFAGLDDYITRRVERAWDRAGVESAERIARGYARLRPNHAEAQALLASLLLMTDREGDAESLLTHFRETYPPTNPNVGWNLALALIRQQKLEDARRMLEEEVETFPNSPLPFIALARVAAHEGRTEHALRFAAEAEARTEPIDYAGQYSLALTLARFPQTLAKAETFARAAANRLQRDGNVQLFVAELLELRGDPESEVYLERARQSWNLPKSLESTREEYRGFLRDVQRSSSEQREV